MVDRTLPQLTFRTQRNNNTYEVGALNVDRWAVTFGTARRGLDGALARPGFSTLHQI